MGDADIKDYSWQYHLGRHVYHQTQYIVELDIYDCDLTWTFTAN